MDLLILGTGEKNQHCDLVAKRSSKVEFVLTMSKEEAT
jgi:hypothetical protein